MKPLLAALLFITLPVWAADPLPKVPHVYVEGTAQVAVAPDQMELNVQILDEDKALAVAKQKTDEKSHKLLAALKALGIADKDIATSTLQVQEVYDYVDGKQTLRGSQVSRRINLTLRDLTKYSDLIKALVDANISQTLETRFAISDEKTVSDQAIVAALADAKKRAALMAEAQGKKLGEVYSISEFQMRRSESYELQPARHVESANMARAKMSDMAASEPFEPGVIKATASVYVVYVLK